ncbi:hypothetical protein KSP39_PZI017579 [Platanthera zijinensis]|uniref:Uncharacterized protein n=1 Tax=Platanthera zijinensis TaxID=2320716 RepID=A0AAP0B4P6_9ASPA
MDAGRPSSAGWSTVAAGHPWSPRPAGLSRVPAARGRGTPRPATLPPRVIRAREKTAEEKQHLPLASVRRSRFRPSMHCSSSSSATSCSSASVRGTELLLHDRGWNEPVGAGDRRGWNELRRLDMAGLIGDGRDGGMIVTATGSGIAVKRDELELLPRVSSRSVLRQIKTPAVRKQQQQYGESWNKRDQSQPASSRFSLFFSIYLAFFVTASNPQHIARKDDRRHPTPSSKEQASTGCGLALFLVPGLAAVRSCSCGLGKLMELVAGYPTTKISAEKKKKERQRTKNRGEKGFIEGWFRGLTDLVQIPEYPISVLTLGFAYKTQARGNGEIVPL